MAEMPRPSEETGGGTANGRARVPQTIPAWEEITGTKRPMTMEEVLRRETMLRAYQRVRRNGGAPGVDGMTVEDLGGYLARHWEAIREELRRGTYRPAAVRLVEIPKPGGHGVRRLGRTSLPDVAGWWTWISSNSSIA
jgi:hypothetical protein